MIHARKSGRKGNAAVEFALVLVPMTLMMLGIMELGRMAWIYQTLASAVKSATRQAIVRGESCVAANPACTQKTSDLMSNIHQSGIGLDLDVLVVELQAGSTVKSCAPASSCLTDNSAWPDSPQNAVGMPLTIRASYLTRPMFIQAVAPSSVGITLKASSREAIQF